MNDQEQPPQDESHHLDPLSALIPSDEAALRVRCLRTDRISLGLRQEGLLDAPPADAVLAWVAMGGVEPPTLRFSASEPKQRLGHDIEGELPDPRHQVGDRMHAKAHRDLCMHEGAQGALVPVSRK
ncbi:unannotated protein [freshwater metagenome]|uniref:Unannotated protein n=1 Tax=freshwater metagenome TaxID=449393 RepID=A0A6J6SPX8_9ZZZZ